ncbi:cytochrome P450 [Paenibacillus sp. UMB4589-SE434]|uniref:cytochrome P450 family protein n=1 Tax=Paenibacillus sp. UMB4589-SE434 TaxID=3046314 RepID=UPI002550E590|nr:cytochrome P450 [Paenibacillus sp. UMB4589-SE434]MDK8179937.1 cytochrome P450 [Paenibacillus sp. UMB4589-SE434]
MNPITIGDFYLPETMKDPITFYKRLREQQEPIIYLDDVYGMGGAWVALNYDDVAVILKDERFVKDTRKFVQQQHNNYSSEEQSSTHKMLARLITMPNMLMVDPPDHTRLRRLVSKAFTPRMIEDLRPRIQQITNELLEAVQGKGRMDLIADFAYPLPIIVICEMLGVPASDRDQFRVWTQTLMSSALNPNQGEAVLTSLDQFVQYIKVLLVQKRKNPGHDLTSEMLNAQEQEDSLSEDELISTIWLLLIAGHETTANLIGNGMLALLQHPEQMDMLRKDYSLLPSAVEEMLRYAGPIMLGSRIAGEDITLNGKRIYKGEMVLVSLAAANLDSQKFIEPDVFNITREENQHLAFGKGIHHCLGAPLARLEGQIAIGTLLQQFPHLCLLNDPHELTWTFSKVRSLASLHVTF